MWSLKLFCSMKTLWPFLVLYKSVLCSPIVKAITDHIQEQKDDNNNTNAVTLQKQELRHVAVLPAPNTYSVHQNHQEIPDNTLSGSSYGELQHHRDYAGNFAPQNFDEHPVIPQFQYGYQPIHYHVPEEHHFSFEDHGFAGHHGGGHGHGHGHHLGFGHRHKHAYGIATKAVLWPLAGLALLGAAAALVTNPILLQLGVVSGRRRRRETEEIITGPDYDFKGFHQVEFSRVPDLINDTKLSVKEVTNINKADKIRSTTLPPKRVRRKPLKREVKGAKKVLFKKPTAAAQSAIESVMPHASKHNSRLDDDRFVPIPLRSKIN